MFPLGYPLIELNFADKWIKYLHTATQQSSYDSNLITPSNVPIRIRSSGEIKTILVILKPLGLRALIRDDVAKNAIWDPCLVFGRSFSETLEQIADSRSGRSIVSQLDTFFRTLVNRSRSAIDRRVNFLKRCIIASKGSLSIHGAIQETGISQKRMEQLFSSYLGMPPKAYANIARFQHAIAIYTPGQSLTELATFAGYYDQSHFIRQFKRFTNKTPRDFFASEAIEIARISNLYNFSF